MDGDHLCLTLPPETGIGLLIQFKAPCQTKPDHDVSALLDVQTVSGRCRVDQSDRDLAGVPVLDVTTGLAVLHGDLELFQMVDDALPVMLEPVCHQYRLTVGGFDQVFQCLQLVIMQNSRLAVFVIDRTIAHLQQFSSQRCSIGSISVPL